ASSRPASWRGPGPHLRPRHPPDVQAGDPDRDADHGAPHARRLLHQPAAVRHNRYHDARQRDRRSADLQRGSARGPGRGLLTAIPAGADRSHDLLRGGDQPLVTGRDMTAAATEFPVNADETRTGLLGRLRPRRNPWRHPWFLEGFTWLYLIWSLVPVAVVVLFSFNDGRSQSVWQGFSLRWYYQD